MKKTLLLLMFTSLAAVSLYPQEKVTLTNSTILKMVKAKLSDELIIDEIKNSTPGFNISPDSVLFLQSNKVSDVVIREMKIVTRNMQPVPETPENSQPAITTPVAAKQPEKTPPETKPPAVPDNKKTEEVKVSPAPADEASVSTEAMGYVIPLQSLMKFYESEFENLEDLIKEWDAKIRISVDEGNKMREKIRGLEKEMTGKINADSKGFTGEINSLKNKLSETRESYGTYQDNMVSDGMKMIKKIEDFGSKLDRSITDKYSQTGQDVKKTDPDPSLSTGARSITITKRKVNDAVVDYVAPLSMILFFYQNEIESLDRTIDLWNEKVASVTLKDKEIIKQIDPLKKQMAELQADQKKNKKPIAELKDRISDLEKERKALNQQMSDDGEDLSKFLALSCKAVQSSLKERIAGIIEEIKYSYQDSFTYKSL